MSFQTNKRGTGHLLRGMNRFFCRNWHRLSVSGEALPEGPVILVSNHLCGLDPLLIQAAVNRPLRFLMSREYYHKMWYARRGFDLAGAIPVNPGGANRHAVREAIAAVRAGHALCLFPEGAANPPIPMHRILPGAALIARESGAPVVPLRVSGVLPFDHVHLWRSFYRRSRAEVVIGKPILLPDACAGRQGLDDDTHMIRHAICELAHVGLHTD
ncbi:MAG: 1-acyl-sn-glycerol-3-phosphate acyltransferase [Zetaproteobacteria bacterium CG12_big_fil_rev_8_21_14_0_65_54_13]|nr:MAG: 1-acyl-sn-glycerol-3-phosphate acyltransferase [Zetaproteobacteria bacterium CG12_big_fil_rev_8_21_14_0_65_54_13]PIX55031.1 MAG: 1-acyl-sn-glycerol-3-phosphate acyltransferase [Zetaproteobacteria bacterium CG_4_10_14_3_um_filter_54_28]PJA28984.1 MAG: 1-acyl-sn-glycerol-3-phosphate acyltransferase [Zetaproteobacteria bacterium CG_4_9_14_3_um_filter_54_145]